MLTDSHAFSLGYGIDAFAYSCGRVAVLVCVLREYPIMEEAGNVERNPPPRRGWSPYRYR